MDKTDFQNALEYLKKNSKKRKFTQSCDLIINLKDLDLKQPDQQLDLFVPLPQPKGKETKICALTGPELKDSAKEVCDFVVTVDEFPAYEGNKKLAKKLAKKYDFFIAQATIMTNIAKTFGRVFGPVGKMPNPKAGCVVPPNANLKPLYERLKKTARLVAKTEMSMKCLVGNENMKDEEIIENITTIYNQVIHQLPKEANNIKSVQLKFTMSKPVKVGAVVEREEKKKEEKKATKAKEKAKPAPKEKKEQKKKVEA